MIRFYLLCLVFFVFSIAGFGQHVQIKAKIIDNLPKNGMDRKLNKKSSINPKACGIDTVEYPRYKSNASVLPAIAIKKNYSLGQIYGAPQDITVHGFTFYAWVSANPPTEKKIRLICNIYKAGVDSLPSGSPLQSDTVEIDSTFGKGFLSGVAKRANFKMPVTVNFPYILTVESDSVSTIAAVVASSWAIKDGDGENLLCGSVGGRWYRGLSLNISGVTLDADMLFSPHVTYKFGTDFKVPDCFDFKDSARFKNNSPNSVVGSKFYSLYNFYGIEQYIHNWNYGELPWNFNGIDGLYKYSGKGNFKIRLISYLYQWHGAAGPCVDTAEKIMYFKPKNPVVLSGANICRGDIANVKVESDTGTIIKWYRNPAGSPVNTGTSFNLGKIQYNDTFYIKAYNYSCESGFTYLIVSVNDYPKHPQISNDSICLGARANLEAKSSLGITEWYLDSALLPIATGSVYQTGSLIKDASYFVRSNNKGCYSPYFKVVTAYVDASFAPDEPLVSKDTAICLRPLGKAILKAYSVSNDSLRWYSVPSGGTIIAKGKTYTFTPSATGVSTLYVEAQKNTCSSSRLPIKITTSDYPSFSQIFHDEKCKGDTAQVGALLSSFGNINWYNTATGGIPIGLGTVIRHFTLKSKNLYAEAEANGCVNPTRSVANIKINAIDSITKIDVPFVCGHAKAVMKVTAGANTVKWYEDEAATKLLASTSTYTSPNLLISTNFYFTVEKNGCKSPVYTVLAEVLPLPIPDFKDTMLGKIHKVRCTAYEVTNVKYKWYMGDGNTYTARVINHQYATYGKYNVKLVVTFLTSGCKDSSMRDIVFDFSGVKPINRQSFSIYPNPTSQGFTVSLSPELAKGKLSVFSIDGKLVFQKVLTGLPEIEINENLHSGTYIIKVESDNKVGVERLMVR